MSNETTHGPCGVPLGDILDLADTLGQRIAALGITDPGDRNTFFTLLGEKLTEEFVRLGVGEELRPYEARLAEIGEAAVRVYFGSDALAACASLGPWPGPALEMRRAGADTWVIVKSLAMLRKLLGVPASDFLDFFVWVQTALLMPAFFDAHPELASGLGLSRPDKRGRPRRFVRH